MIITQPWTHELPLQQQSVLLLACRGCDLQHKHHGAKIITRYIRACVLLGAREGRALCIGECNDTFMDMRMTIPSEAVIAMRSWDQVVDELPLHFFQHVTSAASILRAHPAISVSLFWTNFYRHQCAYMHMLPETPDERDARLNDWDQEGWASHPARIMRESEREE